METATLITLTFLVMFGALLIGLGVEQYFQYRKRTKHVH
jgi:hypothetical protein